MLSTGGSLKWSLSDRRRSLGDLGHFCTGGVKLQRLFGECGLDSPVASDAQVNKLIKLISTLDQWKPNLELREMIARKAKMLHREILNSECLEMKWRESAASEKKKLENVESP